MKTGFAGVFLAGLLGIGLTLPTAAPAQTFDLSFNGTDTTGGGTNGTTATGSFTLDSAADGTYALADVTGFTLTMTEPSAAGTDVFTFGLGDLISLDATVAGGSITAFDLMTDVQMATYNYNEGLWVMDLGVNDTTAYNFDLPVAVGTIEVTPAPAVPEPAAMAVFAAGLAGLTVLRRRARWGAIT